MKLTKTYFYLRKKIHDNLLYGRIYLLKSGHGIVSLVFNHETAPVSR